MVEYAVKDSQIIVEKDKLIEGEVKELPRPGTGSLPETDPKIVAS